MNEYNTLVVENADGYAILRINRPEALNALNDTVIAELSDAFAALAEDKSLGAVILTGTGRSFVAGADIAAMCDMDTVTGHDFFVKGQQLMEQIENHPVPVIAAVNGFALGGGCELALACDIRLASDKAKFGQPEVGLGITPGFGGTQRLARAVGSGAAKYLIYTGDTIDAAEALRLGLVQYVCPPEDLEPEAVKLAAKILAKSPIAVRASKLAINRGLDADLRTGVAFEAEAITLAFAAEDRKEGMSAFLAKRAPEFKNK